MIIDAALTFLSGNLNISLGATLAATNFFSVCAWCFPRLEAV
jgi:hypothetical protein